MPKRHAAEQPAYDLKLVPQEQDQETGQFPNDIPADDGPDPRALATTVAAGLADIHDPLDAEAVGSIFLASIELVSDDSEDAMVHHFLPALESVADSHAATMLATLGALGSPRISDAAMAGVQRLHSHGITSRPWIEELSAPVAASECTALQDPDGDLVVLGARLERSGTAHSVVVMLDPEHCGEAAEILLIAGEELSPVLADIRKTARKDGLTLTESTMDPAEFRWHTEIAMDARDEHDSESAPEELAYDLAIDDEAGPGYRALAPLLRARLRALPMSDKPIPPHKAELNPADMLAMIRQMTSARGFGFGLRPPKPAKLPTKRKTRDGVAPILRLRVDLDGAKPPIWRRLEVPGDISLVTLHQVLQAAFDWDDSHLYMFDTDYGTFGRPDPELGHRSDRNVTLEQVASSPGAKITYTYDFGDSWEHRIVIEEALTREPSTDYPRCTGGRRATPPEDCGGIWGYQELLDILADPDHDDHDDRLEWLGLDRASDFDPAEFNAHQITESLAPLRQKTGKRR
ncbi:plasmid pRiA4b ORF-3 family protein [Nocardia sp. CA-128927]|uniref:plasmid pRiA4b ORF-3 family protein n=1 Tax=Nocardia sp. CA-128927 TaxID=3239975 RepID=UPI003D98E021